MAIAEQLGCELWDIFPLHLYGLDASVIVKEVHSAEFIGLEAARLLPDVSPSPFERAVSNDLNQNIDEALKAIPARHAEAVRLAFGIDGRGEHTLAEIGDVLGVKSERARQILNKALMKLRHPSVCHRLRGFEW